MDQPADRGRGAGYDHLLVKALDHPLRAEFLRLLAKRRVLSAPQALPLIGDGVDLDKLTYQARLLVDLGLIEPAGELDPQHGLPFRLTASGRQALVALGAPSSEEG